MNSRRKQKILTKDLNNLLTCKPLDCYSEILLFLENPPPWRTLCKEITPHSKSLIRNVELNKKYIGSLETPEHFCHYNPDVEDVKRYNSKSLRKTLVCHDMANGYHDDCIIDGTVNYDSYTFYNWAGIDIFCYFSHHLITIPPLGWINVGHAHGVKVIGTIITEWAEGITFWDQMLTSEVEYQNLANALVAIAKTLKFDGWLLNVENKISKPDVLLEFVAYFHKLLHQELKDPVLVWYDSVTIQGNLNWQNGLNSKNKAFFDVCDGFFTNYSWSPSDVTSSAEVAEERVTDLFIGIDVWGRNFYGGGQFNTQEAIKVAYYAGCSLAIFAPAWTHEALSESPNDPNNVAMSEYLDKYGKFQLRDRAFWGSIWPYLNTRVPCELPFQTSFCRGQGKKRRLYGEVLCPSPWYNLRHQQYQPNSAHGPHCYILSTAEKIIKVARNSHYKDKKGIIRYHSSFQMTRQELHAVNNRDSTDHCDGENEEVGMLITRSDEATPTGSDTAKPEKKMRMTNALRSLFRYKKTSFDDKVLTPNPTPEQKNSKSEPKIDEAGLKVDEAGLKNYEGGLKNDDAGPKNDEGGPKNDEAGPKNDEAELKNDEIGAGPSSNIGLESSSRVMQQMSVNLRLGASSDNKTRYGLAHVSDERECLQLYFDDSFTGGACLKVNPSDKLCPDHRFTRLFFCDFACDDTLIFCVVTKTLYQYSNQTLNVNLFMKNNNDEDLLVVLTGRSVTHSAPLDKTSSGIKHVYPLNTSSEEVFRELRTYLLIQEPGFYVPVENAYDWSVRYYQVTVPGSRLRLITLRTGLPQGGILLGHFGICRKMQQPGSSKG